MAEKNERGYNVHVSVNALRPGARQRRAEDIGEVRHIFLDFDYNADRRIRRMVNGEKVPPPNELVRTSIDPETARSKYQVLWRVEGFTVDQAVALTRGLAMEYGADPQPVDINRTCRMPGFVNQKYEIPHVVASHAIDDKVHGPAHFPAYSRELGVGSPEWVLQQLRTVSPQDIARSAEAMRSTARLADYVGRAR